MDNWFRVFDSMNMNISTDPSKLRVRHRPEDHKSISGFNIHHETLKLKDWPWDMYLKIEKICTLKLPS